MSLNTDKSFGYFWQILNITIFFCDAFFNAWLLKETTIEHSSLDRFKAALEVKPLPHDHSFSFILKCVTVVLLRCLLRASEIRKGWFLTHGLF